LSQLHRNGFLNISIFEANAMLSDKFLGYIFQRYYRSRLDRFLAPDYAVVLDHPVRISSRYGYGKPPHPEILRILEEGRGEYAQRLARFCKLKDSLSKIPNEPSSVETQPCWGPQRFFSSLDAVALYGMLVEFRPKNLIEVGSGYSTKFARCAIRQNGLSTHITSIDPFPRVEIDQICDRVIRQPLEDVNLSIFEELRPGDFIFIDSSHRTFTNSDVTIVFMELLPRLREGVLVHIHDIFWPYDYPPEWNNRYYSEQYLLAAYLLGVGVPQVKVLLPNAFIVHDRELVDVCQPFLEIEGVSRPRDDASSPYGLGGGSFWLQTIGRRKS
jgi:hypothetical protein